MTALKEDHPNKICADHFVLHFPRQCHWARVCCHYVAMILLGLWHCTLKMILSSKFRDIQYFGGRSASQHNQQAESLIYSSPMATPWENIIHNPMANALGSDVKEKRNSIYQIKGQVQDGSQGCRNCRKVKWSRDKPNVQGCRSTSHRDPHGACL